MAMWMRRLGCLGGGILAAGLGCAQPGGDPGFLQEEVQAGFPTCPAPRFTLAQSWGAEVFQVGVNPEDPPEAPGGPGVALGDLDGDGWLDALFAVPVGPSLFFRNSGAGELVLDPSATLDGGPLPSGASVALADLDGDGDVDAFWGRGSNRADLILWNDGAAHFSAEVLANSLGETFTGSFGDADGDGDLDLFVGRLSDQAGFADFESGEEVKGDPNSLYINRGGQFVDESSRLPAEIVDDLTFQGAWVDVEDDGDLDLYIVNDFGPWAAPNRLLLNDGRGIFSIDDTCGCDLRMGAMGAAVGDADGDGAADLYITDVGSPNLLVNTGDGAFYDATVAMGAEIPLEETQLASWGSAFVDADMDGWEDLAVIFGSLVGGNQDHDAAWAESSYSVMIEDYLGEEAAGIYDSPFQPDIFLSNLRGEGFAQTSDAVGFNHDGVGRCVAVGDLDRDGVPDLVTGGAPFVRVYRGGGGCGPGITVRVEDGAGNRSGIGIGVEVRAGPLVYHRRLLPSTTFSQSAPELYLGLAGQGRADQVEVVFSDGSSRVFEGVEAGSLLDVSR